jgi:hypothetical protein
MGKRKPTWKPPVIGTPGTWPGQPAPEELVLLPPAEEPPLSRRERTVQRRRAAGLQPLAPKYRSYQQYLNKVWPAKFRTEGPDPDHFQGRVWWYDPTPLDGVHVNLFVRLGIQRYLTENQIKEPQEPYRQYSHRTHYPTYDKRHWTYVRAFSAVWEEARVCPAHFQAEIALLALEDA